MLKKANSMPLRTLPAPSATRFNGAFLVLQALQREQKPIVQAMGEMHRAIWKLLNNKSTIDCVSQVMEPMHNFIIHLQSPKNILFDKVYLLLETQTNIQKCEGNPYRSPMKGALDHYFSDVLKVSASGVSAFVFCCALDPREKKL